MKNNVSLIYNFCLLVGDALAVTAAFTVAYILRVTLDHRAVSASVHAHSYITILLSLLPFWLIIFALLGLYNARVHEKRFSELGRLLIGSLIGILFIISYGYLTNTKIFPARLVTIYAFGLAFFFVLLFRTVARGIRRELFSFGVGINSVLIVGDTRISHELVEGLSHTATTGYRIVGVVGGVKHPLRDNFDVSVFKDFQAAMRALAGKSLHTIVQTELYADADRNNEILSFAQENHVAYRFVPGNSELFVGNIQVDLFHSIPVIAVHQTALIGWGRVAKRLTDLVIGGVGLLIASPFMLLIAIGQKLSDPKGEITYRVNRLTRFGTEARIYKFRTMKQAYTNMTPEAGFAKMGRSELIKEYRAHADSLPRDPRISRWGYFLRNTKLDELPQLINIVRGDMSLVGPRAIIREEMDQYDKKNLILSVKSGLTGLAQISGRADLSFDERRKLDLYYVQNWSLWNDFVIMVKTVWIVLNRKGTR